MILGLFRRSTNASAVNNLYGAIVAAARRPALFDALAVPDTFEGRFECLTLHAALVLRRLRDVPSPGPEMAQQLVDTVFRHFDRTLREMGVGDTRVPRRMKVMAEAFAGRCAAYDDALRSGALASALARNVYDGCHDGVALSRYVTDCAIGLAAEPLRTLVDGALPLPDPAVYATRDDDGCQTSVVETIRSKTGP